MVDVRRSLLATTALAKSFGATRAVIDVDFTLRAGESVAILGENGAGKSTFAKMLAGVVRPDSGGISLDGVPVSLRSPRDALRHGLAFIPQELAFVPELTVAENLLLGRLPSRAG